MKRINWLTATRMNLKNHAKWKKADPQICMIPFVIRISIKFLEKSNLNSIERKTISVCLGMGMAIDYKQVLKIF